MNPQIQLSHITKSYQKGKVQVPVLNDISMKIYEGDFIALLGKSGSGKSTLLNILGLLDNFTNGSYTFYGKSLEHENETRLSGIRNQHIGFVFQSYNLIAYKSALENAALPLYYRGMRSKERLKYAAEALEKTDLANRAEHYPGELSGGECQRVAIARAIAGNPRILIADEPTGALDVKNGLNIINIFKQLNESGITIILATHDQEMANYAKNIYHIEDGLLLNN